MSDQKDDDCIWCGGSKERLNTKTMRHEKCARCPKKKEAQR